MLSRPQIQPYAQLLLGASAAMVTTTVAVVEPARITGAYIVGLAVIGAACVAMVVVWHYKPTRGTVWVCIVPLAAILACAPLRSGAIDLLPVTGMLVIFPIAWLAFAFPPLVTALGVVMAGLLPLASSRSVPTSMGEWASLLTVPALLGMFAIGSRFVAVDLDRNRRRARRATRRLAQALDSSHRADAALQQVMDTSPEAIVVFEDDGTVLLANAPAHRLSQRAGIPISLEQDGRASVYEEDRVTPIVVGSGLHDDILAGELADPRLVWLGEPGDQVAVRFVARPIALDDEPIGVLVVAQDITELIEAVDVRDRFLDTVGHELRTPLTVILGNAELALAGAMPEHTDRWETIQRAAERLEHTVELMLATGRAHATPRGAGPCDVRVVVDRALAEEAAEGVASAVTVHGSAADARIGARDLQAILLELLHNARQVSPSGAPISIALTTTADEIEIAVSDAGPGMSVAERRQAFQRFYRTARSRRSADQGLGLGLSLARGLAQAHGGDVQLTPGPTQGTTALIRLPRAAAPAADPSRLDPVTTVP
ncbi:PAS domain-containing sensor histidine kinase [Microbacterium sp. cf332]|uniref:PAS domain-containing sensor histidine kinase n=1 Tax=Microbacterium sp. cf332 TaxID=1761804 RepID=UPI00088936E2|nr:PAS domain-containing sensor histidine kinase [Microbacterium sp. cf332]SDQ75503.1 Signal transduction histidine kinase [Microbacterium sp. cf332]